MNFLLTAEITSWATRHTATEEQKFLRSLLVLHLYLA